MLTFFFFFAISPLAAAIVRRHTRIGFDDIFALSIGPPAAPTSRPSTDWNAMQWLPHLVPLLQDAPRAGARALSVAMLGDRYHHISVGGAARTEFLLIVCA